MIKKSGDPMKTHSGQTKKAPKPPSGGIKGMTSVNSGACREKTAPTPKSIGGRSNG